MHKLVKVNAKFIDKENSPINSKELIAKLYDNDIVIDDLLAESKIGKDGSVEFIFDLSKVSSPDSPLEIKPDLYIAIFRNESIIYETKVKKDADFLIKDKVTGEDKTQTVDLGTFEISIQ